MASSSRSIDQALTDGLQPYAYNWPATPFSAQPAWTRSDAGDAWLRDMPERAEDLAADSRWPAFFPSPISVVTTASGGRIGLEKVVGASIVNRFPYVIALSFCRQHLSDRHYVRAEFTDILEEGGTAAIQFLQPGAALDRVMAAIQYVPDSLTAERLTRTGLTTREGDTNGAPVLTDAYLVYEARLVRPGRDFEGNPIFESPWVDVGSHRVYFLEINAIQLRDDIAEGRTQIRWRSLPQWSPNRQTHVSRAAIDRLGRDGKYAKGYTPDYKFPAAGTIAFEADTRKNGMAIKHLAALPEDQVEVDNDKARWPCFFPSSVGMITSWDAPGVPNLMPCGSTTIVSRHPLIVTPCVSYAAINQRYAPRKSLVSIRETGRFGCGVPYVSDDIVSAIRYSGNVSLAGDPDKLENAGLAILPEPWAPVLPSMPVHFDCEVVGEVRLGTHIMFLGEVKRIRIREDLSPANPLTWCPWADIVPTEAPV
jgi:flavin reductase (DIM6/NTAB) family NADH-FMN oxidoreductase RutF